MKKSYQAAGADQREFPPQDESRGPGMTRSEGPRTSYVFSPDHSNLLRIPESCVASLNKMI
ncbi:hypothetical protein PM8797T_25141 [Gimesia maris DSM 8797]|nr:hypothetical protein PM8797T_25141 [Gimesia maris DSM 8797]